MGTVNYTERIEQLKNEVSQRTLMMNQFINSLISFNFFLNAQTTLCEEQLMVNYYIAKAKDIISACSELNQLQMMDEEICDSLEDMDSNVKTAHEKHLSCELIQIMESELYEALENSIPVVSETTRKFTAVREHMNELQTEMSHTFKWLNNM